MSAVTPISDSTRTSCDVRDGPMLLKSLFGGTSKFLQRRWCGGPKMM